MVLTKSKALVSEWEDGMIEVPYRGEPMKFTEISEPAGKIPKLPTPAARAVVLKKTKKDHPWRQGYQNMKPCSPNLGITTPLVGIRTSASR